MVKQDELLLNIDNAVVINDTHVVSLVGLCPPKGVKLKDGGTYMPSPEQRQIYLRWREFWDHYVPLYTKGEPYAIIVNGDVCDWDHHGTHAIFTKDLGTHISAAYEVLAPEVEKAAKGVFFLVGSEAHTGEQGDAEEALAEKFDCIRDDNGRYARYEMWIEIGGALCHFNHSIGTSSSVSYETTAVHKELIEAFTEAGMWGDRPPQMVWRAHRHRFCKTTIPAEIGDAECVCNAGWQLKSPWFYRKARGRMSRAQLGGAVVRRGEDGVVYERHKVWPMKRPKVVR